MGRKGNSGYIGKDKRFGTISNDVKATNDPFQHYSARLDGRLEPIIPPSTDIPTPTVWLDANSDYITETIDNTVSNWEDRSGNNLDAAGTPSSRYPSYTTSNPNFNNLPTVDFNEDFVETSIDSQLNVNSGLTVYVVFEYDNGTFYSMLTARANSVTWSTGWGIYAHSDSNLRFFAGDGYTNYASISLTNLGGSRIIKMHVDNTIPNNTITATVYGNGAPVTDTENNINPVTDVSEPLVIAYGNSTSYNINGDIGEYLYYNRPLSASEQTKVENYLSEKFDISLT